MNVRGCAEKFGRGKLIQMSAKGVEMLVLTLHMTGLPCDYA